MFANYSVGTQPVGSSGPIAMQTPAPTPEVTGITATPAAATVAGGSTTSIAIAVQGSNSPGQGFTSTKLSGVGAVRGGDVTMPAATSSQQTGTFRFRSAQNVNFFVDVVLTVAAATPSDGGEIAYATHIFERFESRLEVAQANLVGMHYYVFAQVGSSPFGAPIAQGLFETTDSSGYALIDITGQTSVLPGAPVTLAFTNSNGDPDQLDVISWFAVVRAL